MQSLEELTALRDKLNAGRAAITDRVRAENRERLTAGEDAKFRALTEGVDEANHRIAEWHRSGRGNPIVAHARSGMVADPSGSRGGWAERAATGIESMGGESRAVVSGSIDLPSLIEPQVEALPRPERLIDLLVSRKSLGSGVAFEYLRQTVRTTAAAPVADLADKPTSTYTMVPVTGAAVVLAHLSENVPIRYWQDHLDVVHWLENEMVEGVTDSLERQVIQGTGVGINLEGVLKVDGTTEVEWAGDLGTTLRSALTVLQVAAVRPNAWVLHPADAARIDLARWNLPGAGEDAPDEAPGPYLHDGFTNGVASSANILGGPGIQRVVSTSVPVGTAILGDWSKLRLYVREQMRLDIDASGENFKSNTATLRAECRVGVAHLQPAAFAVVALTDD
ncbi:phage major capsid protein [Mycolicibacter hiberniae]|nr:phage major capsid protein [Mycolicibacter hiberniae]MCV7086562.1 phage major capsid protein [Mycolicibacter hiberniae]